MVPFADLLLMAMPRPQAGYDGTEGMEPGAADASGEAAVESEAADLIEEKVGWSVHPGAVMDAPPCQDTAQSAGYQLAAL